MGNATAPAATKNSTQPAGASPRRYNTSRSYLSGDIAVHLGHEDLTEILDLAIAVMDALDADHLEAAKARDCLETLADHLHEIREWTDPDIDATVMQGLARFLAAKAAAGPAAEAAPWQGGMVRVDATQDWDS